MLPLRRRGPPAGTCWTKPSTPSAATMLAVKKTCNYYYYYCYYYYYDHHYSSSITPTVGDLWGFLTGIISIMCPQTLF